MDNGELLHSIQVIINKYYDNEFVPPIDILPEELGRVSKSRDIEALNTAAADITTCDDVLLSALLFYCISQKKQANRQLINEAERNIEKDDKLKDCLAAKKFNDLVKDAFNKLSETTSIEDEASTVSDIPFAVERANLTMKDAQNALSESEKLNEKADKTITKANDTLSQAQAMLPNLLTVIGVFIAIIIAIVVCYLNIHADNDMNDDTISALNQILFYATTSCTNAESTDMQEYDDVAAVKTALQTEALVPDVEGGNADAAQQPVGSEGDVGNINDMTQPNVFEEMNSSPDKNQEEVNIEKKDILILAIIINDLHAFRITLLGHITITVIMVFMYFLAKFTGQSIAREVTGGCSNCQYNNKCCVKRKVVCRYPVGVLIQFLFFSIYLFLVLLLLSGIIMYIDMWRGIVCFGLLLIFLARRVWVTFSSLLELTSPSTMGADDERGLLKKIFWKK